ncbi:MAG: hypothetical protein ACRC1Y_06745 [Paraclostridium sp.]
MKFRINMCRGTILDIIKLADEYNLFIESIEQGPINDDMMSLRIKFSMENEVHNIESFINSVKENNELNSCELI